MHMIANSISFNFAILFGGQFTAKSGFAQSMRFFYFFLLIKKKNTEESVGIKAGQMGM